MSFVLFQAVERTALLWAAHNGHLDVTRLLLDRGCKIDARGVC